MALWFRLGRKIYRPRRFQDYRRMILFMIRALHHRREIKDLLDFFQSSPPFCDIFKSHPCILEQATRRFFYLNSSFDERVSLIKHHFRFLEERVTPEGLNAMYVEKKLNIWSEDNESNSLQLKLSFHDGQKKEGLLAIMLRLDSQKTYQIVFWIAPDADDNPAIWIGALQGALGGSDLNLSLTRHFHGYRPKNFMLHALRTFATRLNIGRIYAVSNEGYYSSNRVRHKHMLKTSLNEFWSETGGTLCKDRRFFSIPVDEPRKSIDEVASKKRNLYRKRFAFIDAFDATIQESLKPYLRLR